MRWLHRLRRFFSSFSWTIFQVKEIAVRFFLRWRYHKWWWVSCIFVISLSGIGFRHFIRGVRFSTICKNILIPLFDFKFPFMLFFSLSLLLAQLCLPLTLSIYAVFGIASTQRWDSTTKPTIFLLKNCQEKFCAFITNKIRLANKTKKNDVKKIDLRQF